MTDKGLRFGGEIIIALILIGLGFIILLGQLLGVSLIGFLWPFFIIVPGVFFFVGMVLAGKGAGGLAIPGSIVTMVGLILFYQNLTGHWASWAYAWALIFPTALGIGLMIEGAWNGARQTQANGQRLTIMGLIIYVIAAVFFELILNISGSLINKILLPLLLIGLGFYLLLGQGRFSLSRLLSSDKKGDTSSQTPPPPGKYD